MGEDIENIRRYSSFRQVAGEIDDSLKAPEILMKLVAPPKPVGCLKRITQPSPAYRSQKRRIEEANPIIQNACKKSRSFG
jgi:hypothetical protein